MHGQNRRLSLIFFFFNFLLTFLAVWVVEVLMVSFSFSPFRCSLRILDSFGTDAEFNYAEYPVDHGNSFGDLDIHLQQLLTMFRKMIFKKVK